MHDIELNQDLLNLIKNKKALPLADNNNIAFDKLEIFKRQKKGPTKSNIYSIFEIKKLSKIIQSKVNIDTLAPFDIEYFFLQLRAKSIGNEIKVRLRKPGSVDCETEDCQQICEIAIDAEEIKLDREKVSDGKIKITEDIGIKLKYPDIDSMQKFIATGNDPTTDEIFKIISDCIQYIWEGDEIFQAKDSTREEINDFIESLNSEQFGRVRSFFEDMPKLTKDVTWKCSKCEKTAEVTLQGIDAFFA